MIESKKSALVKQIEAYNLKSKLRELAKKDEEKRPFRHLPKQFSKGILIGNIAIVPKKHDSNRFVYVIADMVEARIIYESINLKQTAILTAHYLAEGRNIPREILDIDNHFASKVFEIKNFKRFVKTAQKEQNEATEFVYEQKLLAANQQADELKAKIQHWFDNTFRTISAK